MWYTRIHMSKAGTQIKSMRELSPRRAGIPDSWIKAFGLLKGRKPNPLQELKKMRREWNAYSRKLPKQARRHGSR